MLLLFLCRVLNLCVPNWKVCRMNARGISPEGEVAVFAPTAGIAEIARPKR